MADHLFENQTITSEGLNLIAHATASDAIVYTKALSNATVPADPSNVSSYSGKVGTIASASSSGSAARITLAFGNSDTTSSQAVKCVALMGRLQSESGDGVIVAYCSSGESSITLPSSIDAPCVTRFVVNLVMSAGSDSTINVVESGVASLSDLSRFVSLHVAGDPTTGVNQTILGDKTWEHQQDFNEACRFHDSVVTTGVFPETDNISSLGLQNARYKAIYGETVNSTNVRTSTISSDEASIGSLHVGTILNGEIVSSDVDVELGSSLSPEHTTVTNGISSVYIGSSNARFNKVYAETVNGVYLELSQAATSYKATLMCEDGAILTANDIVPSSQASDTPSCGRVTRPWKEMYVKNAIHLTKGTSSTTDNLIIYEDDGGINFDNSYTGGDAGSFSFRKRTGGSLVGATVSAGEFFGAPMGVVSESHTPTTLPNSGAYEDAPTWNIKKGTIVMAMPCWATARSVFMNRKGAGDSITVTFPNVAQAPFQHDSNYDSDPEKGAWYIASWKFGYGNSPKSMFIPFSTLDSVNSKELFSYLPAGTYRLLCCVEECAGVTYSEYHPEGMCVLLQKIS